MAPKLHHISLQSHDIFIVLPSHNNCTFLHRERKHGKSSSTMLIYFLIFFQVVCALIKTKILCLTVQINFPLEEFLCHKVMTSANDPNAPYLSQSFSFQLQLSSWDVKDLYMPFSSFYQQIVYNQMLSSKLVNETSV